jgi:hypothetical protein
VVSNLLKVPSGASNLTWVEWPQAKTKMTTLMMKRGKELRKPRQIGKRKREDILSFRDRKKN